MPERERIADARFGKNGAQRVVSGFFETESFDRLLHALRRVVEVRNAGSNMRPRPAACAGRHERFQPLPLKRHPALGDVKPAETVLAGVQRVFAAQIHGSA